MHHVRLGPAGTRSALGAGAALYALMGLFSIAVHAGQSRTITDGVYSGEQARRGQQIYQAQCVTCHGDALEGAVGPPLAGPGFLSAWGARRLVDLADKIEKTMPLQQPGSLSRPQATDLVAYILQAGKFPAGQAALSDATLAQITLPGTQNTPAASGALALAPTANLAQLMRAITFPNANILFNTQLKNPAQDKPKMPVPYDYVLWGQTVYPGWQAVDQAVLALQETTPLFLLPGRRCENGRPVPINKADFQKYAHDLIDFAKEMYKASQSRNVEAVSAMSEKLNDTCANCHKVYRDVGGPEGGGLGTDRCRP